MTVREQLEKKYGVETTSPTMTVRQQLEAKYKNTNPQELIAPTQTTTPQIKTEEEKKGFFEPSPDKVRTRDVFREAVNIFVDSEKAFSDTLSGAIVAGEGKSGSVLRMFGGVLGDKARKDYEEAQKSQKGLDDLTQKVAKMIVEGRIAGKDTSRLENIYKRNTGKQLELKDIIGETASKTATQIYGEGLGVLADIVSAGSFGKASAAKTAGQAFTQGAIRQGTEGAVIGSVYGASGAMKENKGTSEIVNDTIAGAITGGIIGSAIGGLSNREKFMKPERATKLKENAIEQYKKGLQATKEKYKQKADAIIPELLDKKWWGTRKNLMEKAEKGILLSQDEYNKLGELQGVIQIDGLIKKIDDEISGYTLKTGRVSSINKTRVKALIELKADILAVDAFDNIKDGVASQQALRELAQGYGAEIYETRKSQKTIMDNKTLSQVKKVDSAIRQLLNKDPRNAKYSEINKVYHLNTELAEILSETTFRKEGHKMLNLVNSLLTGGGVLTGFGTGKWVQTIAGSAIALGIVNILNSTWYNTLRAVQKNNLANKLLAQSGQELSRSVILLSRQGIRGLNMFLNE